MIETMHERGEHHDHTRLPYDCSLSAIDELSVPVLMHTSYICYRTVQFLICVHGSDDAMLLPTRLAQIMHGDGVS